MWDHGNEASAVGAALINVMCISNGSGREFESSNMMGYFYVVVT